MLEKNLLDKKNIEKTNTYPSKKKERRKPCTMDRVKKGGKMDVKPVKNDVLREIGKLIYLV